MWIAFVLAVGFGPVICGWVCPLGSVQEWVAGIGRRIFKHKHNNFIPYKYDRFLRYIRYFILIWVIYMVAVTSKLVFADIDPYAAMFHLFSDELAAGGLIVLAITLATSLLVERPWCKYACPYGALLGISNIFRVFKIRRNNETCINCNRCTDICPMNIEVDQGEVIRDHQCISCLKCSSEEACPVQKTVGFTIGRGGTGDAC
jgi:polyferredoxin